MAAAEAEQEVAAPDGSVPWWHEPEATTGGERAGERAMHIHEYNYG